MGITIKDRVEQFKRECKSITYYQKVINFCTKEIKRIDEEIALISEDRQSLFKPNKKSILLEQDVMIEQKKDYEIRLKKVYEMLNSIGDDTDRQMIIDAYISCKYYKQMINQYHFNDSSAFYRHINKAIEKIVAK